jgi:hypothetical protein
MPCSHGKYWPDEERDPIILQVKTRLGSLAFTEPTPIYLTYLIKNPEAR